MKQTFRFLLALILTVASLYLIGGTLRSCFVGSYQYENKISYAWSLADKSSTIEAKAAHINVFIANIETHAAEFSDNSALWFKTPDGSFSNNLAAVKTLGQRLKEIKGMNPSSFEYQTAIQQITDQEQGEAHDMLYTLKDCWLKWQFPLAWSCMPPVALISGILMALAALMAWAFFVEDLR